MEQPQFVAGMRRNEKGAATRLGRLARSGHRHRTNTIAGWRIMGLTVLLTNLFMATYTGSECVLESLADGLRQAGHRPVIYAVRLGAQGARMAERGHVLADRVTALGWLEPDVIHAQHVPPSLVAIANWPQVPAVNVVHSAFGAAETPVPHPQMRRVVAVDETVAARCRDAGVAPDRLRIILNAVDMDRFKPRAALPARPRRALLLTKGYDHQAAVRAACARFGLALDELGPATARVSEHLEQELPRYDLVFATARMALEAACVGCAVVVADDRGFAGMLTEARLDGWRWKNLGAALLTEPPTEDRFVAAIAAYDPDDAARVAARLRREARLEDAIAAYLAVYREAIAEGPPPARQSAAALAALLDETQMNSTVRTWREPVGQIGLGADGAREAILQSLRERLAANPSMIPPARTWLIATARETLAGLLTRAAEAELHAFDTAAATLAGALPATASGEHGSPVPPAPR
jgi:glycosyltransferase involved in cell wall biosynthesis